MLQATTKAESSTQDVPNGYLSMASKFFHVHHEFRAGKAQQWWETAQAAMAPGGGWDEAVAKNLEAGFYNHSFCPVGPEGPAFCIWEVREGITAEEFQEFIDGPNGVNFGLGAWMNICREINVEMAGNPPYPRKFCITARADGTGPSRSSLNGGNPATGGVSNWCQITLQLRAKQGQR